jgi:site-specific recombinase XerD
MTANSATLKSPHAASNYSERHRLGLKLKATKTGTSRYVDLSQKLTDELTMLIAERPNRAAKIKSGESSDWVFANRLGGPLDDSKIRKHVESLMCLSGMRFTVSTSLRHTFATWRPPYDNAPMVRPLAPNGG